MKPWIVLVGWALVACGGDSDDGVPAERPEVAVQDGEVSHPSPGGSTQLIDGYSYDVDDGRSLDLEATRERIDGAEAIAAANEVTATGLIAPMYMGRLWEVFHFWPNVINLTEVFIADPDFYDRIMQRVLAEEPEAETLGPAIDAAVGAGDRIFIVRDFVNTASTVDRIYHEVNYFMFVNLDARTVTEVRAHNLTPDGLGDVHEPHSAVLQTVFDNDETIWEMCLRGNLQRGKYQAVVVDRVPNANGPEFWLRRMHRVCDGVEPDFPRDEDDTPDPEDRPEPPMGGDGSGDPPEENLVAPIPPELARDGQGVLEDPPIAPWPWKLPPTENDEPERGAPVNGDENAHNAQCNQELTKVSQLAMQFQQQYEQIHGDVGNDADAVNDLIGGWKGDLSFGHPQVAQLYQDAKMQIDMLLANKATIEGERTAALQRRQDAKTANLVVELWLDSSSIWDQMLHIGGDWSNIIIGWSPSPFIPANAADNITAIVIGDAQVSAYQRSIARALMAGKTLDEAHAIALKNPLIYPDGIPYMHSNTQMVWAAYRDCLRELYKRMLREYLKRRFEGRPDEEVTRAVNAIIDGVTQLSEEDMEDLAEAATIATQVAMELAMLQAECDQIEAEIDKIRRQFRADADTILTSDPQAQKRIARQKQWILEAFAPYCANPTGPGSIPPLVDMTALCPAISELLALQEVQNCPHLAAFLMMLDSANCQPPPP